MKSTAVKNPDYPLVLLAGGRSSRMGEPKALLDYKGIPWIHQQLLWLKPGPVSRVIVVVGHEKNIDFDKSRWLNEGLTVSREVNMTPELGPFSSLVCGLKSITNSNFKGVFVSPIDVPFCDCSLWSQLTEALNMKSTQAAIPEYNFKGGHPVLLSAELVKNLVLVPLDSSDARLDKQLRLRANEEITRVSVNGPHVVKNLNTNSDWTDFLKEDIEFFYV